MRNLQAAIAVLMLPVLLAVLVWRLARKARGGPVGHPGRWFSGG